MFIVPDVCFAVSSFLKCIISHPNRSSPRFVSIFFFWNCTISVVSLQLRKTFSLCSTWITLFLKARRRSKWKQTERRKKKNDNTNKLLIIIKIYSSNFSKWQHLWLLTQQEREFQSDLCFQSHADLYNETTTKIFWALYHWPKY